MRHSHGFVLLKSTNSHFIPLSGFLTIVSWNKLAYFYFMFILCFFVCCFFRYCYGVFRDQKCASTWPAISLFAGGAADGSTQHGAGGRRGGRCWSTCWGRGRSFSSRRSRRLERHESTTYETFLTNCTNSLYPSWSDFVYSIGMNNEKAASLHSSTNSSLSHQMPCSWQSQ